MIIGPFGTIIGPFGDDVVNNPALVPQPPSSTGLLAPVLSGTCGIIGYLQMRFLHKRPHKEALTFGLIGAATVLVMYPIAAKLSGHR